MSGRKTFSKEYQGLAVSAVLDDSRPIVEVARELGIGASTLGKWVAKHRKDNPVVDEPLTLSERADYERLKKEVRELKAKNDFLGKASAFFASKYQQ